MNRDRMEFEGVVEDFCKGKFTVKINENYNVLATLSGKIRQNEIKILVGDRVRIEVSEYDTTKGRIVSRLKNDPMMSKIESHY
jgi:translation initiation factor IF-1